MSRYVVRDGVLHAEVSGEEVLLDPDVGVYHLVNATGRRLLERMKEGASLDEAVATVAQEWGRSVDEVGADAAPFIAGLLERALITEVPVP